MVSKVWTDEEIDILRKYYPKEGIKGVHKLLPHRSESSIRGKASMLGISVQRRCGEVAWTEKELYILKEYYPLYGVKGCQSRGLNRSTYSIKHKAYKMGIVCNPKEYNVGKAWTEEEKEVVRLYYVEEGADAVAKRLNRSVNAVRTVASSLGVTRKHNPKEYKEGVGFWSPKELEILKKHYPYGGSRACIEHGLKRNAHAISTKAKHEGIRCDFTDVKECGYLRRDNMWTKEEIEYLETKYKKEGLKGVREVLNRSERAILGKVNYVGLKVENSKNKSVWTEEEIELLKRYYKTEGPKGCIARGINKNYKAVLYRAQKLGLKREK